MAIELNIDQFQPEYLGKLEFYLETLDRKIKKPHERPSIGVLLCATQDQEVVEYALNRSMSPALVAEYQTRMPDKKLLQAKLHEFYQLAESQLELQAPSERVSGPPARKKVATKKRIVSVKRHVKKKLPAKKTPFQKGRPR